MITGIGVAIFGLGLLIFFHELGHFVVGRLMRLRITEFMIGLPVGPKLFSFRRGPVTYGVRAILLGGYVKFTEMFPGDKAEVEKVLRPGPGQAAGVKPGDVILAIGDTPTRDWDDVREAIARLTVGGTVAIKVARETGEAVLETTVRERDGQPWLGVGPTANDNVSIEDWPGTIEAQPFWRKSLVVAAGPLMNLIMAVVVVLFSLSFGLSMPVNRLAQVQGGSPADRAGIQAGDRVVAVDGRATPRWPMVIKEIRTHAGEKITVTVRRDGRTLTFRPTLRRSSDRGLLGVVAGLERRPLGPREALTETSRLLGLYLTGIVDLLSQLFTSPGKLTNQLRSPIGVVGETAPIAQRDIVQYFLVLGGFSFAIAIFNLLPMPPLDGGRLLIWLVEKLSRRHLPREVLAFVNLVGVTVLLFLLVYVAAGDIARLTSPGGG